MIDESSPYYVAAGRRLAGAARLSQTKAMWPAYLPGQSAFVPRLRLDTPAAGLAAYARRLPTRSAGRGSACGPGEWVCLATYGGVFPDSDCLGLSADAQPVIGRVFVDCYVAFLQAYRHIVERHEPAFAKLAAIRALGASPDYSAFYTLHVRHDSAFPLRRFRLTLDVLPGVGPAMQKQLTAAGMGSLKAVATASNREILAVFGHRVVAGNRLRERASRHLARAGRPARGERLGPRI